MFHKKTGLLAFGLGISVSLLGFPSLADWTTARTVSTIGNAENVRLGVNPSGDVFANWRLSAYNTQYIQSAILPAGGSWTAPLNVSDPADAINDQEIAVDWSGNAYSVWNPIVNNEAFILASDRPNGNTWISSTILQASPSESFVSIAARYYGTAVAVWTGNSGTDSIIQFSNFANGAWASATTISDPAQNADHASVGVDYVGNVIAVYESNNGTTTVIQASVYTGGAWSLPLTLSYENSYALAPQVAVNSAGQAVAIWKRFNGGNWIIESATMLDYTDWTDPVELSVPGQDADLPQIGIDDRGRAAAIWKRNDGSNFIIQGSASEGGATWIRPLSISASGQNADTPRLHVNGSGQVVAAWSRSDGTNAIAEVSTTTIDKAAATPHNFWSAPVDLSVSGADALNPEITIDNSGNAVAAWQYGSAGAYAIQAVVGTNLF